MAQKISELELNTSSKIQKAPLQNEDIKNVYGGLLKKFQDTHIEINQHEFIVNS